jgi:hypothetical protein
MKVRKAMSSRAPIIAIHGLHGQGKTTLASKAPNPIAFLFDKGVPSGISIDAVEGVDGDFNQVIAALREIYMTPGEYRSLVIDTMDALEPLVIAATCAENNWRNIESPPYGKGYVLAAEKWRHFIRALTAIRDKHGMAIVMTCHSAIERIDDPRAPTYTSYQLRLHRRARAVVMDHCDIVLFLSEDLRVITEDGGFTERTRAVSDTKRYLFSEPRPAFAAKNRFGLPARIPIGLDFNFNELAKFWEVPP